MAPVPQNISTDLVYIKIVRKYGTHEEKFIYTQIYTPPPLAYNMLSDTPTNERLIFRLSDF